MRNTARLDPMMMPSRGKDGLPLYQQIKDIITHRIINGEFLKDALLPSFRELSDHYGCSLITSKRVYQDLGREGFVRSVPGSGTYVTAGLDQIKAKRLSILQQAFTESVELAFLNGCSTEEMRILFETALEAKRQERENR
ncbi:GntR family transcriptional regulator [Paenibacillus alkaliterrae]|uniref:GntR family transcriptional regulator n=1 Tax=Paenibacillus alkaliterrae TaxID=320909 RepID=UPI001F3E0118|nr:GntR family transcriptional regulator [Paenibacillus alkaliterrae]MCF2940657.1 GntR family transcriptional regulator [Paenibacillus alkaliterrae]